MRVYFTTVGWDDYQHWAGHDRLILERVDALLEDTRRRPFQGVGKPEPLRAKLAGWWSRRITGEHRLVYRVAGKPGADQHVEVAACRYHYA